MNVSIGGLMSEHRVADIQLIGIECLQDCDPPLCRDHRMGRSIWQDTHRRSASELPQRVRRKFSQQQRCTPFFVRTRYLSDANRRSRDPTYQYATATFKVLNAYAGWSNVNYVLNNVKNPVRTLKIAGPLGLGICAVLYLLANVAYFS